MMMRVNTTPYGDNADTGGMSRAFGREKRAAYDKRLERVETHVLGVRTRKVSAEEGSKGSRVDRGGLDERLDDLPVRSGGGGRAEMPDSTVRIYDPGGDENCSKWQCKRLSVGAVRPCSGRRSGESIDARREGKIERQNLRVARMLVVSEMEKNARIQGCRFSAKMAP